MGYLLIQPLLERYPKSLSGGEKQAIALMKALLAKPKLLLLDEPLHNSDAESKLYMRNLLRSMKDRDGMAIVLVTHAPDEAALLCDRVEVIRSDKLTDDASFTFEFPHSMKRDRKDPVFQGSVMKCYEALEFS